MARAKQLKDTAAQTPRPRRASTAGGVGSETGLLGVVDLGDDPADGPLDYPERGPAIPTAAVERVRVDVDTLVQRPDLGPTTATFVAAGQYVPMGLEGHARTPA